MSVYIILGSYIGLSILYIIISISKLIKFKKSKKEYLKEKNKYIEEWKQKAQNEFENSNRAKQEVATRIITDLNRTLELVEKEIKDKENFNSSLLKIREDELDRLMAEKKARALSNLQHEIDDWAQSAQEAAEFNRDQLITQYQNSIDEKGKELRGLLVEVKDYKEITDAINKEILRQRALEEKQDFYRVQISDPYKHDIALLNGLRNEIIKTDILDKIIYDVYISKSVKEMIKRVLSGKDPSGIYKVTNIKTKEIYIGKSTGIGSRWTNHIKSAYGLEGVADSQFQRALKKYGVENFTWEALEEVPKEKLSEREKYYIEFYNTIEYGYNMRKG